MHQMVLDRRWALAIIPALAGAAVAFAAVSTVRDAEVTARFVVGVLFTLTPGLAIVQALFARRDLTAFASTVLALAFGLCVIVLGGWLLTALSIPLDRGTWLA